LTLHKGKERHCVHIFFKILCESLLSLIIIHTLLYKVHLNCCVKFFLTFKYSKIAFLRLFSIDFKIYYFKQHSGVFCKLAFPKLKETHNNKNFKVLFQVLDNILKTNSIWIQQIIKKSLNSLAAFLDLVMKILLINLILITQVHLSIILRF
jgi:hypothetical protein